MILASTISGLIGLKDNTLPWYIPKDLKFFSEQTKNSILIFGNNTFQNLPEKMFINKKNRKFYVLSIEKIRQNTNFIDKEFNSISELELFLTENNNKNKNIYLCGGKFIYETFFNHASELYLTTIKNNLDKNFKDEEKIILDIKKIKSFFKNKEKIIYEDFQIKIEKYSK
ncbi:dihydrofolate reductase [Mycoplasmopsis canis UF31]|uniref:dihydrofolate reductase n=1 Tax=Mycoplasmopsis canis TaxID=29555 RepID=UPI00025ACFAD|nr:dihydrofolate reductase [Mycoplasmopsis canis]EIE40050.1 dihydrofolate reductase [Mycoplasmopsis canis UF31]